MISKVLLISNPVIATAKPVNELSSEITTGMSAPPIGSTNSTPSSSAPASSATKPHAGNRPSVTTNHAPSAKIPSATSALTIC